MELQTVLRNYTYSGFPIVADSNRLVGFITRQDLENGLTQSVKHHGENCIQGKRWKMELDSKMGFEGGVVVGGR